MCVAAVSSNANTWLHQFVYIFELNCKYEIQWWHRPVPIEISKLKVLQPDYKSVKDLCATLMRMRDVCVHAQCAMHIHKTADHNWVLHLISKFLVDEIDLNCYPIGFDQLIWLNCPLFDFENFKYTLFDAKPRINLSSEIMPKSRWRVNFDTHTLTLCWLCPKSSPFSLLSTLVCVHWFGWSTWFSLTTRRWVISFPTTSSDWLEDSPLPLRCVLW